MLVTETPTNAPRRAANFESTHSDSYLLAQRRSYRAAPHGESAQQVWPIVKTCTIVSSCSSMPSRFRYDPHVFAEHHGENRSQLKVRCATARLKEQRTVTMLESKTSDGGILPAEITQRWRGTAHSRLITSCFQGLQCSQQQAP